jgi:DNA mismatch repair protein MutS2
MTTYPPALEEKLGFDVIRAELRKRLRSDLGKDRLRKMRPADSAEWLRSELARVEEYAQAERFDAPVPLAHVFDLRTALRHAAPEGAFLDPADLKAARLVLITLRQTKRYFERRAEEYPALADAVGRITPLKAIEEHVESILGEDGGLRDSASAELGRIRREIEERQARLRKKLQQALREATQRGWATEEQPTLRGGRHVIPVRAEAKRKVDGFVHDVSSSGQTVYIEPAACLELGNEVRELESDERREVERILREATARLRDEMDAMRANVRTLAQLDLLQAKARLAIRLDATTPDISEDGAIDLKEARNPVLQLHFAQNEDETGEEREVVPLSLQLGADGKRTLVITGPNAGGKTVAMKTVGLLALMFAYGLPVPAKEHSRLPLFSKLIADIGDEQSIEDDLSTFSSHVSNLRHMLGEAGGGTLALIDEAGTGTDPAQGGALAQAVLEKLTARGALAMATTHHGTLKAYAHDAEAVQNGSMEFDQESLEPTYRFRAGVPGSSYAFEIAERMDLSGEVLARARELAGEGKADLETLITDFEQRRQDLQRRLDEADEAAREAEKERDRYAGKARKMEKEEEEIRRQALEQAERIVQGANARIERVIREIKEAEAEQDATRAARERFEDYREEISEALEQAERGDAPDDLPDTPDEATSDAENETPNARGQAPCESTPGAPTGDGAPERHQSPTENRTSPIEHRPSPGPIEAGDQVLVDGEREAEVDDVDDEEAVVLLGAMRMRVEKDRLARVGGPREQQVTVRGGRSSSDSGNGDAGGGELPALQAGHRIDLRGRRVREARPLLEELIDEASVAGLERVEILHGKGTGALRAFVHEYLAERPDVASFENAAWDEGGTGVTHVALA